MYRLYVCFIVCGTCSTFMLLGSKKLRFPVVTSNQRTFKKIPWPLFFPLSVMGSKLVGEGACGAAPVLPLTLLCDLGKTLAPLSQFL